MTSATATTIASVLREADGVTVLCHVRPDADTIGSGLALGIALDRRGISVEVAYPGAEDLPSALAGLPGSKLLVSEHDLSCYPLVVSVDAANLNRLDSVAHVFAVAQQTIVIDHHASNTGFGDLDLIDAASDCTATLVLDVIDALGEALDEDIATCVYAGLVTDTGSFKWARPESFRVAARLLEAGVDGRGWSRTLLDSHPFAWFAMVSEVLGAARLEPGACRGEGLVYAVVPHAQLAQMSWAESESVIDLVRTADEAAVAAVFKESEPGGWTVSLRSRDSVDLIPVARALGGGGHRHAAGYSDTGTADEVIGRLVASL